MVKNLPASAGATGNMDLVPELGGSPGGGNSNPLLYSCLKNTVDRRAWQATVHEVAKSQIGLSTHMRTHTYTHVLGTLQGDSACISLNSSNSCVKQANSQIQ